MKSLGKQNRAMNYSKWIDKSVVSGGNLPEFPFKLGTESAQHTVNTCRM